MNKMKDLPIIGKTYNCFDDGKITEGRRYEVTITEVIPFDKADDKTLKLWVDEGLSCDWLFGDTDYFIKADSTEYKEEPYCTFARTKDGGWFSLGYYWNSGRLDIDGDLFSRIQPTE